MKLHNQVNGYLMTEIRLWGVMFAALEGNLKAITREKTHQCLLSGLADIYSRYIPYPLEPETAATVRAAIRNYVTTWDEFDEGDILDEWFWTYLIDQGAREIPDGAFMYVDGKFKPKVNAENEKEVRDCFQNDVEFERFKVGEDYSKGLATIMDTDYDAHYERMVKAIHKLVDSGRVQKGVSVYLETVPMTFLKFAPLVEGEWLDRYVVVLAESGAIAQDKGYKLQETSDHHPLAWPSFADSNGAEINQEEIHGFCRLADRHLKSFTGRIREIGGRPYVNFEDYCSWQGRKVKGELKSSVTNGFITASWNKWLDAKGAKRQIAGVQVDRLQCYVEAYDYILCLDGVEDRLKQRGSQLSLMGGTEGLRAKQDGSFCKEMAGTLISTLFGFQQAVTTIKQRYYNGEEILFPDLVQSLSDLTKYTEDLIKEFNDDVAGKPEYKMDIEALRQGAGKVATERVSYLVDMAKADALDALGEHRAATELVEQYIK
jgi:hypothetical protein